MMSWVAIHLLLFIVALAYCNAQEVEGAPEEPYTEFPNCELLDLAFALDASDSIGAEEFNKSVEFLRDLLPDLNVGLTATRIAAVQFSRSQNPLWRFGNTRDAKYFDDQLAEVSFGSGGRKRLSSLFSHIGFQTFSSRSGNRASVPDMVVIFTDAQSNDRPQSRVSRLRRRNIRVAIVAVGEEPNLSLINQIVDDPIEDNIFHLGDANQLVRAIRRYAIGSCPRGDGILG